MLSIISIIIVIILLLWVMKIKGSKYAFNGNVSDTPYSSMTNYYEEALYRMRFIKYKSKILTSKEIEAIITTPFFLSILQDYDCFFIMTEEDGKFHFTDDVVFYNSEYRYSQHLYDNDINHICITKNKERAIGHPCSKDGSIIYEDNDFEPNYVGHRIDLSLVDERIKTIILIIGEYPFDKQTIKNFTLRLSRKMIYWDAEEEGINDCLHFEDVFLDDPCKICEVCSFKRCKDGTWMFTKETTQYSTLEDVFNKYDHIQQHR